MNNAIRTSAVLGILIMLLLAIVGCASQKSIDDLNKQLADVNSRLTRLEQAEAQKAHDIEEQNAADASNRMDLDWTIKNADRARLDCKVQAEKEFNEWLHLNGTPVPGKEEVYTANRDGIRQAKAEQDQADADCQKEYENAIEAAKLKYSKR